MWCKISNTKIGENILINVIRGKFGIASQGFKEMVKFKKAFKVQVVLL